MRNMWTRMRTLYKRNESYLSAAALLLGFIIDNITLTRVDLLFDNFILLSYLLLAAGGIALFNFIDEGKIRLWLLRRAAPLFPLLAQFAFGGLFSGYFIFYSRSASSLGSWIFVLVLAVLLIGNERFKNQYLRFRFQISILFVALFSFTIFSLPVVFKTIGPGIFLLSGFVSVALIIFYIFLLSKIIPEKVHNARVGIAALIGGILFLFNGLYFLGAIPPLPLSLKDVGVYHEISRISGDSYQAVYEAPPWYAWYKDTDSTFRRFKGESVTVFSSVFAPTNLTTAILHEWQHFDDAQQRWVTADTFSFPIVGGRDGGYRGYSTKTSVPEGSWRVNVITQHGQVVGRTRFTVEDTLQKPRTRTREL